MADSPDFWLVECDTFWHDGPPTIACRIVAGPARMIEGYDVEQWLVEVEPKVHDHGVEMDRVLVDPHPPDWQDGEDWKLFCTGAYSVDPSLPREQRLFHISQTIGGHKITVTTQPDVHI